MVRISEGIRFGASSHLQTVRKSETEHHLVTKACPTHIEWAKLSYFNANAKQDLDQRYTLIGTGYEWFITSIVHMEVDASGKIAKVQYKWNGKLPENRFLRV